MTSSVSIFGSRNETMMRLARRFDTPVGLVSMFAVAFLLRLAIAPNLGFFSDLRFFQRWTLELSVVGTHGFYAADPYVDYPPGYLYVLWLIGKLSPSPGYLLLKLPALIGDLCLAWMAGIFAVRLAPESMKERVPVRAAVAAAVLFNPAVIALSAGWGQADVVPVCFMIGSLLLVFTGSQTLRREVAAALLFGVAFSMKPQTCLASPVIAYALYRRYFHHKTRAELMNGALRIVLLAAVAVGVWAVSGVAFGLGPVGLFQLYLRSSKLYPVTSVNAFNFWGIFGFWRPDSTGDGVMKLAGIPAGILGLIVFVAGTVYVVWRVHRAIEGALDPRLVLLVGAAILSLIGYTFLTRMHERYMFNAIACFAPLVFVRPLRRTYAGLSVLFILGLWYPYAVFNGQWHVQDLHFQTWFDWVFGGFATDPWQKKALSSAVTAITVVAAWRCMAWVKDLVPRVLAEPERSPINSPVFGQVSPSVVVRDQSQGAEPSRNFVRWVPLSIVGLSSLIGLVILRGETRYAENLNDSSLHLLMVRWASGQLHEGRVPFDGWFPYFAVGSSFFHHYQSLSHILTALIAAITRTNYQTVYLWLLYLLLALWPISVYASARLLDWGKWTAAFASAISPLIVSAPGYGYEHGSYTWQGLGVYSQEWGMWLLPLAWGLTWRAVSRGKQYAAAAVALALTMACHFTTGYLALLTIGVWVIIAGRTGFAQRFYRAAIAAAGSLLIAAWVLVPLVGDTRYSAQSEYYKGTVFNDSYGASKVLGWLIKGQLFDLGRFPVVTLLFAAGTVLCIMRFRKDARARALLGALVLSLLLFFGRPTLGPVLDLLPGFRDLQIHRFLTGVDLAAILLAGVGLQWLLEKTYSRVLRLLPNSSTLAGVTSLLLFVALVAPAWKERTAYAAHGATLIRSQQSSDGTDGRNLDGLVDVVRQRGDGRVYAGMRANWGQQYRVGYVPVHAWLADRGIDAIGFSFRAITSLSTDVEAAFDENDPAQYEMLNVRYVIVPSDRSPTVPATLIMESGRHRLYEVKTSGYFQVVDRAAAVSADRISIQRATLDFRNSHLALQGVYPGVAFAGASAPAATFAGTSPPSGSPGDVFAQTSTLQDGLFDAAVEVNRPAVVLLKATYDPRWTATVDGRAVKPTMMAPSLVGVDVSSGIHNISFRYKPYAWYPLLLSIGALTLLALVVVPRRIDRGRTPSSLITEDQEFSSSAEKPRESLPETPSEKPITQPAASVPASPIPVGEASLRRALFAVGIGCVALILAAYSNSLHNSFHFDDGHVVVSNLFIRDLGNIPRFFADARTASALPVNANYRPLVTLSLAVDYALAGGLDPVWYHVTQIVLLLATGALLFLLYLKLYAIDDRHGWPYWAALFAATLFCIHTGNTEVANYISARSELISGLGVLGAFVVYLYAPGWRRLHLYLIPMILGALAKTPAVMFAPLLLAYILLIEEQLSIREIFTRAEWHRVRRCLVASAPAFALGIALYFLVESMNPPSQSYGGVGRVQYLLTQTWVWPHYARLFFLPNDLTADSGLNPLTSFADKRVIGGLLLLAGSLVLVWRLSRKPEYRPIAFGIIWFWIALLPSSSIFPLGEVSNDHRAFFPFMGLTAAMVWWAVTGLRSAAAHSVAVKRRLPLLAAAAALLVLVVHAVGTYNRNRVWATDESLWADVVKKNPQSARGLMNYGVTQMEKGRFVEARDLFTRGQALAPNYPYVMINLGIVDNALNDTVNAERWFNRALEIDPSNVSSRYFYARYLVDRGRAPEAIDHLRAALTLSGGDVNARHLLLQLYAARGDTATLSALVRETLALSPTDSVAQEVAISLSHPTGASSQEWLNRGLAETRPGQYAAAAAAYRNVVGIDPANADAWNNLGWTLGRLGFFVEAVPALQNAVRLRPNFDLARNNLAWAARAVNGGGATTPKPAAPPR